MGKTMIKSKIPKKKVQAFIEDFFNIKIIQEKLCPEQNIARSCSMLILEIACGQDLIITRKETDADNKTFAITLPPNELQQIACCIIESTLVNELFEYCGYNFEDEKLEILSLTLVDTEGANWSLIISINDEEEI